MLSTLRRWWSLYIIEKMSIIDPSLSTLISDTVVARLTSKQNRQSHSPTKSNPLPQLSKSEAQKSTLPCSKKRQHPHIWTHVLLHLYKMCYRQEQRSDNHGWNRRGKHFFIQQQRKEEDWTTKDERIEDNNSHANWCYSLTCQAIAYLPLIMYLRI